MKSLAQETFSQFLNDATPLFDVTRGEASTLLSGLAFVDAWRGTEARNGPLVRLFLNPNARNPLSDRSLAALRQYLPDLSVD